MPMVDIPGVGGVDFPETMSQEDIVGAIHGMIAKPDAEPNGPSLQPAIPAPGTSTPVTGGSIAPVTQAFPVAEQQAQAIRDLPSIDPEQVATTPFVKLPPVGAPGTALRGVSDVVEGAVEQGLLTPASGALGATMLVPGLRSVVGAALTAAAAKSAAQDLGTASVTGDRETLERGLLTGALAGVGALGTVHEAAPAATKAASAAAESTKPLVERSKSIIPAEPSAEPVVKPVTPPSADNTLGISHPATAIFNRALDLFTLPVNKVANDVRIFLREAANETAPKITASDRLTGEAAGRAVAAHQAGKDLGYLFADEVLQTTGVNDLKFGTALKENDLRGLRQSLYDQANKASRAGELEKAIDLNEQATKVTSLIDQEKSPFATEDEYHAFMKEPATQEALALHESKWTEQKDPLFRQANDLSPDVELARRGLDYPTRINLTVAEPGSKTAIGGATSAVRQLATLLRRDKFAKRATGTGTSYEGSYRETMASAFAHEYPVAAQHEFINKLIASGDAVVGKTTTLKGEPTEGFLLRLRPWSGNMLQVRKSLAREYGAITGLEGGIRLPYFSKASEFLTHQSIQGLGEGTAHAANLLMKIFTGPGPTPFPWANAAIKPMMRADLLYTIPRAIFKGLTASRKDMLDLVKINAAKTPYAGVISSKLLNPLDRGIRLMSAELYRGMAKRGIVPDTETGLREFVNESGNYTKAAQNMLVRNLRSTGVNPFATGFSTAAAQALRRTVAGPGMQGTTPLNKLALRADIIGGFVGTVATVAALNKYLTGSVHGLPGTPAMSVSWKGPDDKPHYLDVGNMTGFTRGVNILGIKPYLESRTSGLSVGDSMTRAASGPASAVVGMVAGPAIRAGSIALTGKNPYGTQVSPIAEPAVDNPFHSQVANNITEALREVNPIIDTLARAHEGTSVETIAQRQLTRWAPRTGMGEDIIDKLPTITARKDADAYIKDVAKRARNLTPEAAQALFDKAEDSISELDDPKARREAMRKLRFMERNQ